MSKEPEPLSQDKDIELRRKAVEYASLFLKDRNTGDLQVVTKVFEELYTKIYNFISQKPF